MSGSNMTKIKGMKRILSYITIVSASVLFFSCVKEMEQVYEDPKEEKIFYASVDNKDSLMTKTVISQNPVDGKYQLHWLQEDCIGISSGNNTVEKFVNISTENGKSAIFKGSIATSSVYYAVYPYKEGMTMPSKKFTVEIPAVQPYAEKTFAPEVCPMAGKSDSDSKIYFNNLCGVLVINLTGSEKIRSISFSGKDVSGVPLQIGGEFTVDMNYSDAPTLVSTENSTSLVTVKCENPVTLNESTPTQFHFVLPPAEYTFRLIISTDDGKVMIKEGIKPLTIKRANITKAGALEYVETIDIDLSENGNANCYIVNKSGLYSFDATVIGNGEFGLVKNDNFHTDDVNITPASAELLWSSPETAVSDVNFDPESGKISFYASGIEGNALIAAKDAEGNILWSWHIWATDQPQDQHYINSVGEFDVQDRNLGATRADRGTGDEWKESIGAYYQWGRKDPFISTCYSTTGHYQQISIPESILSPNSIVVNNYVDSQADTREWMSPTNTLLWQSRQKTIYDPCPAGYIVAENVVWNGFTSYTDDSIGSEVCNTSEQFDKGWNFFYNEAETTWYPSTGRTHARYGTSIKDENHCYLWSSSHASSLFVSESDIDFMNSSMNSVIGCPVRCMKDNKTTSVFINWVKPCVITQTSVTVFASLKVYGATDIKRGFVYGDSVTVTLEDGIDLPCDDGEGEFSTTISDLNPATRYYVRPYAVIDGETHYGAVRQFTTPNGEGYIDLSTGGTSNCYVISMAGSYRFNCSVKGNGTESVGVINSAAVLWETLNTTDAVTLGSVVSSVSLEDGYINFSTPATFTPGNALIVVKSITGKIVWSWHIWAVDFDPEGYAQEYPGGALMMDRNLGALNNDTGDAGAFGLFYQWGRKDPFVGSGNISRTSFATTSPEGAITYVESDSSTDLLDYATRYPSRVIKNSTWNNSDLYWTNIKTQYDPCPPGWRVPDRDIWRDFNSLIAFYPEAGYVGNGSLGSGINNWTNERNTDSWNQSAYYWNGLYSSYTRGLHDELPVRCMKDAVFTVSNKAEADVVRDVYVTVSGTLTVSDDTKMEAKGFICSTTSDPKIYTEGCIMTDEGTASGDFTSTIKGLKPGTTYYIRAYAKGGYNVRYGNVITVKTKEGADGEGYIEDDEIFEW